MVAEAAIPIKIDLVLGVRVRDRIIARVKNRVKNRVRVRGRIRDITNTIAAE